MTENLLFEKPQVPTVTIKGSPKKFPVKRVFCVGRNYEAHAREMGVEVDREQPFYFIKTAFAVIPSGSHIPYPPGTDNYHYEMELVIAIGKDGFNISVEKAHDHIYGYAAGLDMTRRDLQLVAREKGRPWDLGKDFEQSAVISEIVPASEIGHPESGAIELQVNGAVKQSADIDLLIWKIPEIIAHLSRFYHLSAGDLIYTGTPAGVGPVVAGDRITGSIANVANIELTIDNPAVD
ncbi:MAG: fumarylacetoacetate hydrolase family protein [Emcibacter sp.]|nr:fumarylacetoacetate hydrolase family protein [Emcibacter sp.]MBL4894079.1 fumarylacetoacetate hydrolase family protein [Emcibacter sp.]